MVSAVNSAGESGDSAEAGATTPTKLTAFDFDGDGTADLTYYRPSTRTWNGKGDLAIFRPARR